MFTKKKIIVFLALLSVLLYGNGTDAARVYFSPETPDLIRISDILESHHYILTQDSLSARYYGNVFYYSEGKDSIRCEIQLHKDQETPFILDSFMTEPVSRENVRNSIRKMSIWMLLLNLATSILFFARST